MNKRLDEINQRIREAEERIKSLKNDVRTQSDRLDQARDAEAAAIINRQPAIGGLTKQVTDLQAAIAGTQRAWAMQTRELEVLQAERKDELQKIGRSRAEIAKAEITDEAVKIYSLLVELTQRTSSLKAKAREYTAGLQAEDPKSVFSKSVGVRSVCSALEAGIAQCLDPHFPSEIFADEKLPRQEALKRTLRAGSLK